MRIGILGPGALGGFMGGVLARAGHHITLISGRARQVTPSDVTISSELLGHFQARVSVVEAAYPRIVPVRA
jgi:ketopantoate reductase